MYNLQRVVKHWTIVTRCNIPRIIGDLKCLLVFKYNPLKKYANAINNNMRNRQ